MRNDLVNHVDTTTSPRPTSGESAGCGPVTSVFARHGSDGHAALDEALPMVVGELRRLAQYQLGRVAPGQTLPATALVNEVYLRWVRQRALRWQDRAHFFACAARTMRHILVDHARAKRRDKRGGGVVHHTLENVIQPAALERVDVVALHQALGRLATLDARQGRIVELRVFAGLSLAEVAALLEISVATVVRDWTSARAWLITQLSSP